MRSTFAFLAAVLLASTAHGASPSPPKKAPQVLAVIACKTIDMTGQKGRHGVDPVTGAYDETSAAQGWRDLELYINPRTLEYECKREVLPLEDAVTMYWPPKLAKPLDPDFGDHGQCGRVGMSITANYEASHKGWGVVAIGCPSMIGVDADGDGQPDTYQDGPHKGDYVVKDWKLPGCPTFKPGTYNPETGEGERMKCNFDASAI